MTSFFSHKRNNLFIFGGIFCITAILALIGYRHWSSSTQSHEIFEYQPKDRPQILKMLQNDFYWLVSEGAIDFSPEYMLEHRAATLHYPDNSLSIMVYRNEQGTAIGFVTYHKTENYSGRIQFLAVDADSRKKGVGRKLIVYALNEFKKQGICSIDIAVRSHNTRAYSLYRSLGFEETGSTPDGFVYLNKFFCAESKSQASYPLEAY